MQASVHMPSEAVRVPLVVCWLLWRPGPSWYPLAAALAIVADPASIGTFGIVGLHSITSTSPFSTYTLANIRATLTLLVPFLIRE